MASVNIKMCYTRKLKMTTFCCMLVSVAHWHSARGA